MNAGSEKSHNTARFKHLGSTIETRQFGKCVVVDYLGRDNVIVRFEDDTRVKTTVSQMCRGSIKNPMTPFVRGIGFVGQGDYGNYNRPLAFKKWHSMLERCHCPKYLKKKPSYSGCSVSEEWHNFQNFAKWWDNQYYESGWHLDKDLLKFGNKVYSKDTCSLVPREINMLTSNGVLPEYFKIMAEKWKHKISKSLYESLMSRGVN